MKEIKQGSKKEINEWLNRNVIITTFVWSSVYDDFVQTYGQIFFKDKNYIYVEGDITIERTLIPDYIHFCEVQGDMNIINCEFDKKSFKNCYVHGDLMVDNVKIN